MTAAALRAEPPKEVAHRSHARLWWRVHHWVGLKLSLFLSFILLTGTLAVLSSEIDWLMRPAMRVSPATVSGPVAWPEIARNAAAHSPEYRIRSIDAPIAGAFAASVMVAKPDGTNAYLYAHPSTGRIQGEGHWVGAKRVLRNMHRHLNLPVKYGVPIVCSLAFLLLVSLVTSLIVYKKWWRGFLKPIRMRDARTGWGDLHRLAGVWSIWFAILIIATGIWYFAEETFARAPKLPDVEVAGTTLPQSAIAERLAASLAAASATDPKLGIQSIAFPDEEDGAFIFQGEKNAILVRPRANAVWTEASTGAVRLVTDGRDLNVHQRISEMADPLHFGTFGGYWTKIIWFLSGALLTGLSLSGVALYSLRLLKREKKPAGVRPVLVRAWAGMGHWRVLAAGLVMLGFALIPSLFAPGS